MAKEVVKKIKLQIPAGKASPAPPVGTVLGPAGINLQEFCTRYNDATRDKMGDIVPVEISVYEDRTFDFVLKTPPTAELIKKYAKIKSGSKKGAGEIVGSLSAADAKTIAEIKMPDLNAYSVEEAVRIIAGTARNMGVTVDGVDFGEMPVVVEKEEVVEEVETTEVSESTEEATETENNETEETNE